MAGHGTDKITSCEELLSFWFSDAMKSHWFSSTPDIDSQIREKFHTSWEKASNNGLDDWLNDAPCTLALVILLDQLPLNMFRGQPASFSTEQQAVTACKLAIARGFDKSTPSNRLAFLYMPLMHSENIEDQELSVNMFSAAGLPENLKFARHHRDIIKRFGRFPHRNEILGRQSSQEEINYLSSSEAFKG